MQNDGIFEKLFVFEVANNHMGDVEHGLRIMRELSKVSQKYPFRFGIKFQYRDLAKFIHSDFTNSDHKHVKRFQETKLSRHQFDVLRTEAKDLGFMTICTPFDEKSVGLVENEGFDLIKVASCSLTDWPLIERIGKASLPVLASTAGASIEDVDKVVSYFSHRDKEFALMHCVGEYPTHANNLELDQIDFLKTRYPGVCAGFSTHESPDNFDSIKLAVGKGATVFEKHVGIKNKQYDLNDYSAMPHQVDLWLGAAKDAYDMCSTRGGVRKFSKKEITDLRALQRGVFAGNVIKKGQKIVLDNVLLAIPNTAGQVVANDLSKYVEYRARKEIPRNAPINKKDVEVKNLRTRVLSILEQVRRLLIESSIKLPRKLDFELSHHYGLEKFEEWGATIINCINREYCKKLIILLPGQKHPVHYHKKKEETFHVLYGDVEINIEGDDSRYNGGDIVVVERHVRHSFSSQKGAVFEEVSTTHFKDDSYYEEKIIEKNKDRKTEMTFWSDWLYEDIA